MTNPPAETQGFVFNQTMMRIKDPAPSLDFYQQVLGMTLYQRVDFAEMSFSLYFLGYPSNHQGENLPSEPAERHLRRCGALGPARLHRARLSMSRL